MSRTEAQKRESGAACEFKPLAKTRANHQFGRKVVRPREGRERIRRDHIEPRTRFEELLDREADGE